MADERALTIVHMLGSFEIGGAEQVALNIAREQKARGHDVHVISMAAPPDGPHRANFDSAGIASHRVPKLGPLIDVSLAPRLAMKLRELGADIAHTHNPLTLIYGAPAARLARVRLVHTKHGFNAARTQRRWLRRVVSPLVDRTVAVSAQTAEDARSQKECRPGTLSVIENGITLDGYSSTPELRQRARLNLGLPEDAFIIGTVGRMTAVKNQRHLVRAAGPLLTEKVRLLLIGTGPERPEVERQVKAQAHPEWIMLAGQRTDVPALLPALDVFALPSKGEGLPMVLPEAMACSLPIVATAVGGVPEVVQQEVTGIVVPPDDEDALRGALKRMIDDPDWAKRLGAAGRERALVHYSASRMVDRYMELYRELVA